MYTIRKFVTIEDILPIKNIIRNTNVFKEEEITIAGELVEEAALKGADQSGYFFILIEQDKEILGYSCFGRIPLTQSSYDLYWIAVDPKKQNQGLAAKLLSLTEEAVAHSGGTQIYAETSSRSDYIPARKFYEKSGFEKCALQKNFYSPGDDKVTFVKII